MRTKYHQPIDPAAPNEAHALQLQLIGWNRRLLELGASSGHMTQVLVDRGCRVTAVERDADAASELQGLAERVVVGDLDDPTVFDGLPGDFDVVLAGDVLEHLLRPREVLARAVRLLAPGGRLVASIPHVGHADVRLTLMRGSWEYRDWGLMDDGHVRWFTLRTIRSIVSEAGLVITELLRVRVPAFETELQVDRAAVPQELVELVLADPEAETYQFVLAAELDGADERLARMAERNLELQSELERVRIAHGALRAELELAGEEARQQREQALAAAHAVVSLQAAREQDGAARDATLASRDADLHALAQTVATLQAQIAHDAQGLRRIDESVSWQAFMRLRTRLFAVAGGEGSRRVRTLQALLRMCGRLLGVGAGRGR